AYTVFVLGFATFGALIASRQPRNPIGWIMCVSALAFTLGGVTGDYASRSLDQPSLPGLPLAAWLSVWTWSVGAALPATFLLLLFPDGRLPSRRWRPVGWIAGVAIMVVVASLALAPGRFDDLPISNPFAIAFIYRALQPLIGAAGVALFACALASIGSLIVRFRRAEDQERLQLKWLAFAVALVAFAAAISVVIESTAGSDDGLIELSNLIVTSSMATMPMAIGVAVLKHRLYNIDRIINRTLVYGALSAILGLIYIGGVVGFGSLVRSVTGQTDNSLGVAASTLGVAALVRPLRSRVQGAIDHRFYRRKYDAARTLEMFSSRLRDEVDLDLLSRDLVGVIGATMQPAHVSLWLRSTGRTGDHP
ncbi:MAG: hypothetical protein M3333_01060, partial [Actinomycetota bacterium]|nr:hypothetical protein [Actinomycetota bacterium]